MDDERRKSCCDQIIEATTSIKTIKDDIRGLKGLYKPVYGLCILFIIASIFFVMVRSDAKDVSAAVKLHEEGDNAEFYAHEGKIKHLEGRYEVIESLLREIRQDQKEILKWQREHK